MKPTSTASFVKLLAQMALFVLIGIPLVGYLWNLLNDLLALQFDLLQIVIAIPVLLVFAGLLKLMAGWVGRAAV
jgi:hypothetical protein